MGRNDLALYDAHADQWWAPGGMFSGLRALNPGRFAFFDMEVDSWAGLRILDVGCGGGYTCEELARRGARVVGVDRSARSLVAARAHARRQGLAVAYVRALGERLPVDDASLDVAICVDVLEHVDDPRRVVAEIHRALKPGGLFLFDTINRSLASRLIMIVLLERIARLIPRGAHDWNSFITPRELAAHLADAGFGEVAMRGFVPPGGRCATGTIRARLTDNLAVIYMGRARKSRPGLASWSLGQLVGGGNQGGPPSHRRREAPDPITAKAGRRATTG